ncbi:hypothetical protein NQ317_009573 [Molorchus minor]|uniref:Reverse transcriptase domain-containing protein n=1 Tax=Molorchus minor TaxID=1323400 RepID=A0ABQ9J032_9CUCU|nr:hypothetical protein NQ317_009573 [Molorchus minor]
MLYMYTMIPITLESALKQVQTSTAIDSEYWRSAKQTYQTSLLEKGPKAIFKYTRSLLLSKISTPIIRKPNGTICDTNSDAAEILAQTFKDNYTQEVPSPLPQPNFSHNNDSLQIIQFTEQLVSEQIGNLKEDSAPGSDGITSSILKKCVSILSKPLAHIMQTSFDQSNLPSEWLTALVTPIYKKGDKLDPLNYRAISLVCIPAKLMERIIVKSLLPFLLDHRIIPDEQHGFVPGRSTTTNLLQSVNSWMQLIDNNEPVDILYLDFSKAFDKVSKRKLLFKLDIHGIRGLLLRWIEAFLSNRLFKVRVGSSYSNWHEVLSGVPQGSVLGPILFLIYSSDLQHTISSSYMSYADDNKLYGNPITNHALLQADLLAVELWSNNWSLPLNSEKCTVLHIGKKNPNLPYQFSTGLLTSVDKQTDLGIIINSNLNWSEHITTVVKRANTQTYLLRKCFTNPSPSLFQRLYKTYIRPLLEYGVAIWSPHLVKDIMALEKVQRTATRMITSYQNLSYEDRLTRLKLQHLTERRKRGDAIQTYRILHNDFTVNLSNMFTLNNDHRLRGHSLKLTREHFSTTIRQNFLTNRVFYTWNLLPEEVVSAPSVNSFKNRYDRYASGNLSTILYYMTDKKNLNDLVSPNRVILTWMPGHSGVRENKLADKLARERLAMYPIGPKPILGVSYSVMKELLAKEVENL